MARVQIGLSGYRVIRSESKEEETVYLELENKPRNCRHCASGRLVSKGPYQRRVRHLDTFGRPSRLLIETKRFECRDCRKSFVPEMAGVRPWRRSTEPWRQSVYRDHHEGICAKALAKIHRLGSATVERIYAEFTSRKARERVSLECPSVLGVDEHRVHRGQPFATTFCDLRNRRIFDIVPGRSEADLLPFLKQLKGREKVRMVCIDLSSPYRSLIRRWFPKAKIVADRFHVIRVVLHHFMELARQIAPDLKHHRGNLAALRSRRDRLEPKQLDRLQSLFKRFPALEPLYDKIHELWSLLSVKHQNKHACRKLIPRLLRLIEELKNSRLDPLAALARTLQSWLEPIIAMWRFTRNNGITEGFHRKMKLIQRRAYGFKSFHNYRLRVIAQCG